MAFIKKLTELNKGDAGIAGGKGASLGEMINSGIPVPPGFVVLSSAFEHFVQESGLVQEIDTVLHSVSHQEMHTVEHASEKIQALILNSEMPQSISQTIEAEFKSLDAAYVAVRSSATAEDGADHAWAGQLDSYLNTTEREVLTNVRRCWASLFTPRAIFYRFEKGLHSTKISVAVVVQKMIESEASGIAFSVHPVTEDRNQLIIEAGFGLGEAIVSGSITPDSYVVEKEPRNILDIDISTQTKGLYRDAGMEGTKEEALEGSGNSDGEKHGNNVWKDIPEPKASSQVLTEAQIFELSEIIIRIEKHYGFPCDIEWAYKGGTFYIVQSRPITTLSGSVPGSKVDRGWEYKLIFASDGFAVLNTFNLKNAGYIRHGGVLTSEHNKKVSLYIKNSDLVQYGKDGYEIFSSREKTQRLMDDIANLIKETVESDELHVGKAESYSDTELAEHLKATSELSVRFISLYGLIESHHTYYTEDVISRYIDLNNEGLKDKPVFSVIFDDKDKIKDQKIKDLCENVASLAEFKLSTKEKMHDLFNGHTALVREARKRFALLPTDDLRILSLAEIQSFLLNGFDRAKFDQIAVDRKDWFVIESQNNEIKMLSGDEAKREIEDIKRLSGLSQRSDYKEDLKGQTASVGLYRGRAVVIPYIRTVEDEAYKTAFAEFKQGDILVTKNTVPEIIEIIKKAAAIVTEEGGITCHGAIMAREFKVPGIVGVDGVADAIETGELIEVDARGAKGIVRKI